MSNTNVFALVHTDEATAENICLTTSSYYMLNRETRKKQQHTINMYLDKFGRMKSFRTFWPLTQ